MTVEEKSRRYDAWKRRAVVAWAIVGIFAVFVILVRAGGMIRSALDLLLAGVIIGFICSPITNWLDRKGMPRGAAALVALVVVVGVAVAICALIVPPTIQQIVELLRRVPLYVAEIQNGLGSFWNVFGSSDNAQVQSIVNTMVGAITSSGTDLANDTIDKLTSGVVTNIVGTVNGFVTVCLGLVLGYWFAKDYPAIAREFAVISGPEHEESTTLLLAVCSRSMGGYMRGIVITSLVNGLGSFLALLVVGHPYASLMGIVCGVFHFVPVIGPWLAVVIASGLALFVSPWLALVTLVLTIVVMNVTDNVVSPLVMQSAVKVHPALSLLGIMVGSALGGVLGMVLAIPLTAALRSAFVYYFESKTGRQLVSYDGALFRSTPYYDDAGNIQPSFDALDDPNFFESTLLVHPVQTVRVRAARQPQTHRSSLGERIVARVSRQRRGPGDGTVHGGVTSATMGHADDARQENDGAGKGRAGDRGEQ